MRWEPGFWAWLLLIAQLVPSAAGAAAEPGSTPSVAKTPVVRKPVRKIERKTTRVTLPIATPTGVVSLPDGSGSDEEIPPPPADDSIEPPAPRKASISPQEGSRWFVQAATGYAWVKARELEDAIRMHLERNREVFDGNLAVLGSTGQAEVEVTNSGGGSFTAVEAGYRIGKGWGAGLRFGISRGPSVSGTCRGTGSQGERLDVLWDFDYRMTALMPGLWMEGGDRFRYRGGASAGIGWGRLSGGWTLSYDFKTPLLEAYSGSLYDEARGKGLVMEFGGDVSYPLNDGGLSAFLGGSYRAAKASLLEAVETGDAETDAYLAHLEIDFGGIALMGGLRLEL